MADDADLLISAAFSDAKLAAETNKVVGLFAAAGKKAQDAFNKTAADAVENSQVVKANTREIERLKRAYDPLYAASKRYEGQLDKLNRAHKVGAINAKQHEAALERLNAEYQSADKAIAGAGRRAQGGADGIRNLGFQVQDFAVQVGAGTSATQAFAQQFPQLASGFGPLGIAIGTAAAVLVPLGSALLGAAFDSETLEDKMKALGEATDAMSAAMEVAKTPIEELRETYGDLAEEIQRSAQLQAEFASAAAGASLLGAARGVAGSFGAPEVDRSFGLSDAEWAAVQDAQMQKLMDRTGATREQVERLMMAIRRLETVNGPEAAIRDGENLLRVLRDIAGGVPQAQEKFGSDIAFINDLMAKARQQIEDSANAQEKSYQRLVDQFDADTQKLKSLADRRAEAEAGLAQAVVDGNEEKIASYQRILDAIDSEVVGIKTAIAEIDGSLDAFIDRMKSRASQIGGGIGDAMKSYLGFDFAEFGEQATAAQKGILDLIKSVESKGDYNITLDNGRYSGGPRDLVNMTLNEVLAMQKQMLAHPDNKHNSSAAGAYQIVSKTLRSLISELGLTGNELYSKDMQDRLAMHLLRRRQGQGVDGLRNEWEGLRNVSPAIIQQALGQQSIERVDPDVEKATSDALKEQVRERERQLNLAKQLSEQLSSNLLTEQQSLELDRQRAEQVAAINASDLSDEDKAAAIAAVNAALEKQATILKLTEDAKRRGVDLDAQMIGSAMTYRQAIEALGETQRQQIINQEQINSAQERAAEQQQFMNDMQDQLKNGLLDAIIAGESFADVLSNIAQQFARAALEAALFNSGPMAGGGGGGLLGGVFGSFFKGFSSGGYTGSGGRGEIAGVVHGGEYVMSAAAVQRIGLPSLDAIHRGTGITNGGNRSVAMTIDLRGTTGDRELDAKIAAAGKSILAQVPAVMDNVTMRQR